MSDLVERLKAMARHEHDDLSIGDEAADRIVQLERELAEALETLGYRDCQIKALQTTAAERNVTLGILRDERTARLAAEASNAKLLAVVEAARRMNQDLGDFDTVSGPVHSRFIDALAALDAEQSHDAG